MYRDNDLLLYVISAKTEMLWAAFKKTFDSLYTLQEPSTSLDLDTVPYKRRETVRAIEGLGHCDIEFSGQEGKIYVAPPVLARLPVIGLPQAVLAGGRSPRTVKQLSDTCQILGKCVHVDVRQQAADLVLVPSRVLVQADSPEYIAKAAELLGIAFAAEPPAWAILQCAGSLDDYLLSRQWLPGKELNWSRKDFDFISRRFGHIDQELNTRLSCYIDPLRKMQIYLLWQEGQYTQVDRSWGQYAVFRNAGVNVLVYDPNRHMMAVPTVTFLPRLFARSLALCSGYAAQFIPAQRWPYASSGSYGFDFSRDVPPQIAETVATKLGQTLLPYSLGLFS